MVKHGGGEPNGEVGAMRGWSPNMNGMTKFVRSFLRSFAASVVCRTMEKGVRGGEGNEVVEVYTHLKPVAVAAFSPGRTGARA